MQPKVDKIILFAAVANGGVGQSLLVISTSAKSHPTRILILMKRMVMSTRPNPNPVTVIRVMPPLPHFNRLALREFLASNLLVLPGITANIPPPQYHPFGHQIRGPIIQDEKASERRKN